jgi:hypothetical protein
MGLLFLNRFGKGTAFSRAVSNEKMRALQSAEKLTDCRTECARQSVFLAAALVLFLRFGLTPGLSA